MAAEGTQPSDATSRPPGQPDVFLSYAREDRARAEQVARVLGDRGWSVWWDSRVGGGQIWKEEIAKALAAARCVVVLWSHASTRSHWVLDEAQDGHRRGLLVPAVLDDAEVPLGFRQVQTIDLSKDGDDDAALDDLAAAAGRVLGRPQVEQLKPSTARRRRRHWAAWTVLGLPPAVILLLHVTRADRVTVDLEVTASEASFTSAEEQEVSELMVVSTLEAAGLDSIHIPRARGRPEQILPSDGRRVGIRIAAGEDAPSNGTITLVPVLVARGAQVTLAAGSEPLEYRMSLSGSPLPVQVNLQGPLEVVLAGEAPERVDFGAPKPMRMEADPAGAEIAVRMRDRPRGSLIPAIKVSGLSFIRIDERVRTDRTVVTAVSTIRSGLVRVDGAASGGRTVGTGDELRLGELQGELRVLQPADAAVSLRFDGEVGELEACSSARCESWMPTRLEALAARQTAWLVVAAVVYVLAWLVVARRWLRIR